MFSKILYVLAFTVAGSASSWAAPNTLNYQGRIIKANGQPLEYNNVSFVFEITSPNGSCVVYREQVDGINMQNSKGIFDVPIGTGTKLFPADPLFTLSKAFDNGVVQNCFGGTTYTPIAEDVRVLKVQFHDGTGWRVIDPPNVIRSVPFAQHAQSAQTIGGMSAGDFVTKTQTPVAACSAGQVISFDGTNFVCVADQGGAGVVTSVNATAPITVSGSGNITVGINVGTAAGTVAAGNDARITGAFQAATTLGGDLSGTLPNPTVSKIQGQSVSSSTPSNGQVLKYNTGASQWQPVRFGVDDLISETGLAQFASANCASNQTLTWSSLTDIFTCTNISISESNIAGNISGTKISGNIAGNAAGFTGSLAGDVSGTQGATSVDKIKGKTVNLTGLTDGQVLRWNNSANEWQPSTDANAGGTITALTGEVTASGSGSVAATIAANAVTSAKIADGTIVNADISATAAIVDTKLATISTAGKVANSATTGTASSVADTLVLRDPAGNFAANDVSFSSLDVRNASANKITFNAPASFSNYVLTLPTSAGTSGHVLTTNGAGVLSWTSPSAGSVTSVSASSPLSVSSPTTTPQISIAAGTGDAQVLRWNTTNWSSSYLNFSDLKSAAGLRQIPGTCTNAQTLVWQSASDTFACTNISLAANQVANVFAQGGNAFAADAILGTTDNYKLSFKANNVTQMTVSDGSIAFGTAPVDPNHRLTVGSDKTDVSQRGINIDYRERTTTTGSYSNLAGVFKAQETVSPGVTNSGGLTGIWSVAFRNNLPGFDDSGTLSLMKSMYVQYGHYNSEAASTPQTTAAYGIEVSPYYRTGTIGTMYDYYAHVGATGGTVTNHYGVFIAGPQKKNHFEGTVGIGTTTPTISLDMNGKTDAVRLPAGTNAQRPTVPGNGMIRYNTTGNKFEAYENGGWINMIGGAASSANSVTASVGSATTPSISFSGDPDTGFYNVNSDNTISVATGGGKIFDFSSTGLTSPTTGGALVSSGNGTAGAPTFSFAGDTDTGWFRPAADTLAASTAGQERVRIGSSGNVGIGTTAPTGTLHIASTGNSFFGDMYNNTSVGFDYTSRKARGTAASPTGALSGDRIMGFYGRGYTSDAGWGATNTVALQFLAAEDFSSANQGTHITFDTTPLGSTSRAERMRIDAAGNVGIATNNPRAKLDVNGSEIVRATGPGDALWSLSSGSVGGQGGMIFSQIAPESAIATNSGYKMYTTGTATNGTFYLGYISDLTARDTVTNRLTVLSSGNIGIGTTNPTYKLDVAGQARVSAQNTTTAGSSVISFATDIGGTAHGSIYAYGSTYGGGSVGSVGANGVLLTSPGSLGFNAASGSTIAFTHNSSQTPEMIISSSGYVGIGTSTPARPMHVAQSAAAGGNTAPMMIERVNASGTPVANELTMLQFKLPNSAGTGVVGADIGATLSDVTPGSEKGVLVFRTSDDGGSTIPERMRITSDGSVGINTNNPSPAKLTVGESRNNTSSGYTMFLRGGSTATTNGTYYNIGLENTVTKVVSNGVTDNGYLVGYRANTLRNFSLASDRGTLADLTGMMVQYGHYNFDASAPTTTIAYGIRVNPYFMTGTIDTMYDIFAGDGSGGGTATNRYGLYIGGLTKTNFVHGGLGIGTNTPSYKLHVMTSGAGAVAGFSNGTGTCTITPNTSSLSCSSDMRLKEDIDRILGFDALNKVLQLQAHTYRWKNGDGHHYIGYIAQEAEKVVPELVTTGADGYKQVSYSGFIPLISEAIKEVNSKVELQKRSIASENADMKVEIETLKKENQDLKNTLQSFEQRLRSLEAAAQKK